MRILGVVMCLLVSACASNAPGYVSGSQMKSGWKPLLRDIAFGRCYDSTRVRGFAPAAIALAHLALVADHDHGTPVFDKMVGALLA